MCTPDGSGLCGDDEWCGTPGKGEGCGQGSKSVLYPDGSNLAAAMALAADASEPARVHIHLQP